MMSVADLRQMSVDELNAELKKVNLDLVKYKMMRANGGLSKSHLIGESKRKLAIIKTITTEKCQKGS